MRPILRVIMEVLYFVVLGNSIYVKVQGYEDKSNDKCKECQRRKSHHKDNRQRNDSMNLHSFFDSIALYQDPSDSLTRPLSD